MGNHVTLITDHATLQWMAKHKQTNCKITCWFLSLQGCLFQILHHGSADVLSLRYATGLELITTARDEQSLLAGLIWQY